MDVWRGPLGVTRLFFSCAGLSGSPSHVIAPVVLLLTKVAHAPKPTKKNEKGTSNE